MLRTIAINNPKWNSAKRQLAVSGHLSSLFFIDANVSDHKPCRLPPSSFVFHQPATLTPPPSASGQHYYLIGFQSNCHRSIRFGCEQHNCVLYITDPYNALYSRSTIIALCYLHYAVCCTRDRSLRNTFSSPNSSAPFHSLHSRYLLPIAIRDIQPSRTVAPTLLQYIE